MFKLKVKRPFFDTKISRLRERGEVFSCSPERAEFLLCAKNDDEWGTGEPFVELLSATCGIHKKKPSIILSCELLYKIGGIETFYEAFLEKYGDYDITVVVRTIDPRLAVILAKKADIVIDKGETDYKCDVLILNHWDTKHTIYGRCEAKEIYHVIHGDWVELKKDRRFRECVVEKKDDVVYVAVSKTVQKSFKKVFGIDSIVVENPLREKQPKPLVFLSLTRASEEKGIDKIIEMANRFRAAGKNFVWILCADVDDQWTEDYERPAWYNDLFAMPELVLVRPSQANKALLYCADYLVQPSKHESFCYSAREALQYGVPVILTDFTEAKNIVKKGQGYIVKQDLSDLDVDAIFGKIPTDVSYKESLNNWGKLLEGGKNG